MTVISAFFVVLFLVLINQLAHKKTTNEHVITSSTNVQQIAKNSISIACIARDNFHNYSRKNLISAVLKGQQKKYIQAPGHSGLGLK